MPKKDREISGEDRKISDITLDDTKAMLENLLIMGSDDGRFTMIMGERRRSPKRD